MEIYLIRHGETRENVFRRHQPEDTPLTENGERQAREVAKQISGIKPTHLISSTLVRSLETAREIGKENGLVPETSAHFVELMRPSHLHGHRHTSLPSIWFYIKWCLGRDTGHKDDSESYRRVRDRIKRAQDYLSSLPPDARVVVVSHSVFISLFVAHLCRERSLSLWTGIKVFYRMLTMPNTDITVLSFDPRTPYGTCAWSPVKQDDLKVI
jgi:probable phosphoglycerate mutase